MSLTDSIDAAMIAAVEQHARPFRLDLTELQIEALRAYGQLGEPVGPKTTSPGAYKAINIYPTFVASTLMAQLSTEFGALIFPIKG
ncbi:hypothetical protein [Caulobacter sp. S45]|uniref:hypothetical protein n=1 Tax=Caulobacter sp. S45 TaxID=1641861 RepID=UPI00131D78B5|nr:hypothetical protein [Caulobacter sp. S45]